MENDAQLSALIDDLAEKAVKIASAFGLQLDYSVTSMMAVEDVLGKLHDAYARTGQDDGYRGIALEFGAYIMRVIDRNYGPGRVGRNHDAFGPNTFPYQWNGLELFPVAWCEKRLLDGPAEDVAVKFKTLVVDRAGPSSDA